MRRRVGAWLLLLAGAALPGAVYPEQVLIHTEHSLYRQVLVYDDDNGRCLCFTRLCAIGRQSCVDLHRPDHLVFDYTRMMLGALLLAPAPRSVLVIGLGGGTLPHALEGLLPQASIDVVEIDPAVERVAEQYFAFRPDARVRVYEEDGRAYVRRMLRTDQRYQLIMLDAYDHQYIPEHMLTREFLTEVRNLLVPGGVVAANTFSSSRLYQNESVTYAGVFGTFYNLKSNNRVILASAGPLPQMDQIRRNADQLEPALSKLGVSVPALLERFNTSPDWDPNARVLTDQYSPANLLNAAP
jgi:spermidine synthase